ncbi:penicillin acylase family protein [Lysobacter humi (ex Lee et al. 2017)]
MRIGRILKRLAIVVVALIAAVVLAIWLLMRGSLPRLDGREALAGLGGPARIERDALGVATVSAGGEIDAMRALGYVHGQERFFEMDLMRRLAAGELAALFGERALPLDREHRRDRLRARLRATLPATLGAEAALVRAYAEGVNAGVGALRTRPWPYLLLRREPAPWREEDSALVVYAMYYDLQDAAGRQERLRADARPHLPAAVYALLTHAGSSWDAPLQGASRGDAVLPGPEVVDLRRTPAGSRTAPARRERAEVGSNNFAVAGSLTADGRAIVADDMHLKLRAPNIWYRARLRYADPRAPGGRVDVAGFSLPGVPGIVVGSNTHVAWGFTNSYGDWVDWLRIPDCTRARCAGRRIVQERIDVAGGASVIEAVHESDWGPIEAYRADGTALARRWVAHVPGSANLGVLAMARARSLDEAMAVADRAGMPAQNLVVGDRDGRIGWRLIGPVPQRAAGCRPTELSDPRACPPWGIASKGAPAVLDPADGRVWTANARVVDGEMLARIGDGGYVTAVRARMIRDGLQARTRFTERDLLAIQLDDRSLFLQRWHALLQASARRGAPGSALRALATAAPTLEPRAAGEAVGYRLVRAWRERVSARMADGLLGPARRALGPKAELPEPLQFEGVAWPLATQRPLHLLDPAYASWDALFEAAAADVRDELAPRGALAARTWAERNTASICHPLADALPLGRRLLCMPADPLPGDTLTPRAQGPDFGASQRMVVAPGHEADGIVHMPGGQSGNPLSPFWGAGHADWVQGRPTPFLPGATRHALELAPAAR